MKIMSIAGAKPNFMKVASITDSIRRHNEAGRMPAIKHVLVHTGQHYYDRLSRCFFEELELPRPDVKLEVGSASHPHQTAEIMRRFEPVFFEQRPGVMIVVGDVNSTVACALVAAKVQYQARTAFALVRPLIVHVEAGLRSRDRTMPEEINRLLTDALTQVRQKKSRARIWCGFGCIYGHYLFHADKSPGQGQIGQPQPVVDHLMLRFGSAT